MEWVLLVGGEEVARGSWVSVVRAARDLGLLRVVRSGPGDEPPAYGPAPLPRKSRLDRGQKFQFLPARAVPVAATITSWPEPYSFLMDEN